MKKKFALVTATAITVLLLFVGCGVKVTNISVPDTATLVQKRGRRSRFNDLHRPLFVKAFARRNVEKNR